jgi:hypothetical protein
MADDDEPLSQEQARILWLLTADTTTWDLGEAPEWLARECLERRLVVEVAPGRFRKTVLGHEAAERGVRR